MCKEHFVNFSPQYDLHSFTICRCQPHHRISHCLFLALDKMVPVGYTANNILYKGYDCEGVTGRARARPVFPKENCRVVRGSRSNPRIRATSRRLNETQPMFAHFSRVRRGSRRYIGTGYRPIRGIHPPSVPAEAASRKGAANRGGTTNKIVLRPNRRRISFFKIPLCLNRQRGFFIINIENKREE